MKQIKKDIVVIGGGPGGLATAITAARQGSSVLLVERNGYRKRQNEFRFERLRRAGRVPLRGTRPFASAGGGGREKSHSKKEMIQKEPQTIESNGLEALFAV